MARKDITDKLVCMAYIASKLVDFKFWPYELLRQWTGQSEKVCFRACERAFDNGFIDYGTSLRSGWVTGAGLELIEWEDETTAEET